jgi:hypothetical protein
VVLSETSHVNCPVIKTYKLAEQTGSYTLNPTREDYGSKEVKKHTEKKCIGSIVEVCQAVN